MWVDSDEFCHWAEYYKMKNDTSPRFDSGRPIEELTQEQIDASIDAALMPAVNKPNP